MLSDPTVEVQWIFIHRALAERLLEQALAQHEDLAVIARAAAVLHQPSDAQPHDDHMHVRVYCAAWNRSRGCVDKGPARPGQPLWQSPEGEPVAFAR